MMCVRRAACATAFIITMHPHIKYYFSTLLLCTQNFPFFLIIFHTIFSTFCLCLCSSHVFCSGTQKENEEIVVQDTERTKAGNNKLFMK